MLTALRYYWITAKGYRLRPWASPYIRWRLETFFGGDMHALGPEEFFGLIWRERRQLSRFIPGWMNAGECKVPRNRHRRFFCHSERSEESLFLFIGLNLGEILRFAQNDKVDLFPLVAENTPD